MIESLTHVAPAALRPHQDRLGKVEQLPQASRALTSSASRSVARDSPGRVAAARRCAATNRGFWSGNTEKVAADARRSASLSS